jgi:hypothetical protein
LPPIRPGGIQEAVPSTLPFTSLEWSSFFEFVFISNATLSYPTEYNLATHVPDGPFFVDLADLPGEVGVLSESLFDGDLLHQA